MVCSSFYPNEQYKLKYIAHACLVEWEIPLKPVISQYYSASDFFRKNQKVEWIPTVNKSSISLQSRSNERLITVLLTGYNLWLRFIVIVWKNKFFVALQICHFAKKWETNEKAQKVTFVLPYSNPCVVKDN